MDPFAQAHLSELLAAARIGPPSPSVDPDEQKERTFMTFNAALTALKGVGSISDEEITDWTNRMLVDSERSLSNPFRRALGDSSTSHGSVRSILPAHLIPRRRPDSSVWCPSMSLTAPWHTVAGSRSSGWSSTATRSQSTGDSHRYLIQRPCSPPSWLNLIASITRWLESPPETEHDWVHWLQ